MSVARSNSLRQNSPPSRLRHNPLQPSTLYEHDEEDGPPSYSSSSSHAGFRSSSHDGRSPPGSHPSANHQSHLTSHNRLSNHELDGRSSAHGNYPSRPQGLHPGTNGNHFASQSGYHNNHPGSPTHSSMSNGFAPSVRDSQNSASPVYGNSPRNGTDVTRPPGNNTRQQGRIAQKDQLDHERQQINQTVSPGKQVNYSNGFALLMGC